MNPHYHALGFDQIVEKLKDCAFSAEAKEALAGLSPMMNEEACRRRMDETTWARGLLDSRGAPPLASMQGMSEALSQSLAGGMLPASQLGQVARFAASCQRMAAYLSEAAGAGYAGAFSPLEALRREIERCVGEEEVYSEASPRLREVRRQIEAVKGQIKEKLNHILHSRAPYLADNYITTRAGRWVLPVKRQYQAQFGGTVVEVSGKGATVFMEPTSIARQQQELNRLSLEEDEEARRILYSLSALVAGQAGDIQGNMRAMEAMDVMFARAKLSAEMKAGPVEISGRRFLAIVQGRHPLMDKETCVPLNARLDEAHRGLIITGPNTGGKTVALKTVGLLTLMAQCGLHIPCGAGSHIAMCDGFFCDIGDSQSLSANLSTFSGHITSVIAILGAASKDSLVLLDELGSGTDPAEGMGLAVAILEELRLRGCFFLATTHYPQVKTYAAQAPGVVGARMAFDRESLKPLYLLECGKAGESCALYIAQRLGLPDGILERARYQVYGGQPPQEGPAMQAPKSALKRLDTREKNDPRGKFCVGDSVVVLPDQEPGIVFRPPDEHGDVVVKIKGEMRVVRHNRVKLRVSASELYPPDYDFSILFDTVANRKAKKTMAKRHDPNAVAHYDP